jgi:hypothetical protein
MVDEMGVGCMQVADLVSRPEACVQLVLAVYHTTFAHTLSLTFNQDAGSIRYDMLNHPTRK